MFNKKNTDNDFITFISKIFLGITVVISGIFTISLIVGCSGVDSASAISDDFDEIVFYRVSSRGRPAGVEAYRMVDEHTGREYIVLHDRGTALAIIDAEPKETDNEENG